MAVPESKSFSFRFHTTEYFLQQQIKNIQDELGAGQEDEIDELRQKGKTKKWSPEMAELFEKEVSKLERTNSQSPDFNVQLTYLQTLLGLPWNVFTTDNLNISNAEKTLNKDHYGLEKVKERILEHLAVLKLKGDMKSPIICLYGPPGVGKTSLGRSIAASLKRKYVRMSLGGVHDEAEIRGHRKTYIGAMPGDITLIVCVSRDRHSLVLWEIMTVDNHIWDRFR
jgi:ATP-dependent Lon protease